jgi:hypothetical protein
MSFLAAGAVAPPRVLLTSTCLWPLAARLALRFAALGWCVEAVCPSRHPLHKTSAVGRTYAYKALRPLQALASAVTLSRPDLIVPCDDRALAHLHAARAADPESLVARIAGLSLGAAGHHRAVQQRGALIRLAQEEGVRAPDMRQVRNRADLRTAVDEFGLPVVLKVDGTWGGMGVIVAKTLAEADRAWRVLARRFNRAAAIKCLILQGDPYQLLPSMMESAPQIYVQRFVRGRAANIASVCWSGETLASIQVEALQTRNSLGASTVVRTIEHAEMARAGERVFRRLGISGFCGLDFILEEETGDAHLIEMNARSTPVSHLALGPGRDLVAALVARLQGDPSPMTEPITGKSVIALFPDACQLTPDSDYLSSGYHDVPWEEPALVKELARSPHSIRRVLSWLKGRLSR